MPYTLWNHCLSFACFTPSKSEMQPFLLNICTYIELQFCVGLNISLTASFVVPSVSFLPPYPLCFQLFILPLPPFFTFFPSPTLSILCPPSVSCLFPQHTTPGTPSTTVLSPAGWGKWHGPPTPHWTDATDVTRSQACGATNSCNSTNGRSTHSNQSHSSYSKWKSTQTDWRSAHSNWSCTPYSSRRSTLSVWICTSNTSCRSAHSVWSCSPKSIWRPADTSWSHAPYTIWCRTLYAI